MGGSLGGEVSKRGVPGRWGAATPHEPVSVDAAMLQQMQPNQMPHRGISCNPDDHIAGQTPSSPATQASDISDRIPNSLIASRSHKVSNDASDAIPRTCRSIALV